MSTTEFKTQSEYFADMMATLREESGRAIGEHSEPALRLRALASELEALGAEAQWIWRQSFPQTADGERLDLLAETRGLVRTPGSRATGSVRFVTDGGAAVTVPEGTSVMTAELRRFVTTAELVIPEGSTYGDAAAAAVEAGSAGNVGAGALCQMAAAPAGVLSCTNVAAMSGGADDESDESLRSRLIEACRMSLGVANEAYYRSLAMSVDGVAAASVVPNYDGNGAVAVYAVGESGNLPGAKLLEVADVIQREREIGVQVSVFGPIINVFYPTFYAKVKVGADKPAILAEVRRRVAPFFGGHTLGKPIYVGDIMREVLSVPGILSARFSTNRDDFMNEPNRCILCGTINVTFTEVE